jgi:transcriptional regulator with XRE-family HTH domain
MKAQHITKATLAQRMNVSRVTLDRLLKGDDTSLTLATLSNVADTLGKKLKIELVDDLAMA